MNSQKQTILILGTATVAAGWLIAAPDLLLEIGLGAKAVSALTYVPVMLAWIAIMSRNRNFMRCEMRAFNRLIGRRR